LQDTAGNSTSGSEVAEKDNVKEESTGTESEEVKEGGASDKVTTPKGKEKKTKEKTVPVSKGTSSTTSGTAKRKAGTTGGSDISRGNTRSNYVLAHMNLREGTVKEAFSDLALTVTAGPQGGQSGTINCHAPIVSVRCSKIDKALKDRYDQGKGKKAKPMPKKKGLDLRGSDAVTISRVLDYLYSDECPWLPKLKPLDLLNLVIAARRYSLDRLVWICENQILETMGLDNIIALLKGADELKDDRIRKFCMDYMLQADTFKEFVLRKDLTNELGMELFSELVTMNATAAATGGTKQLEKLGDCPPGRIKDDFKELYNSMLYSDASVKLDGENIQFHKAILAAASKHIYENFSKAKLTAGQSDDVSETLEISKEQRFHDKLSADAFRSLLKFVYYGDTDIDALPACFLIPFVRYYGLNELQELCEKVIQQSVTNSKVVLKIMAVTYLAIMAAREDMRDRLRKDCLSHCMSHLKDINLSEIKQMDKDYALDLALDLLIACQKTFAK